MNKECYKNLTQKELEELYIDSCKSTSFLSALDLLTHSNLRKNISLEAIQEVANIMKQEYDDYHYYSVRDFNYYLQERTTFTKEFFAHISPENHHNLINKAIKYGDLETIEYLLTSPDLYKFWKSFKFDKKVLSHVIDYGHAEILDFFLSSSKVFIALNYHNLLLLQEL